MTSINTHHYRSRSSDDESSRNSNSSSSSNSHHNNNEILIETAAIEERSVGSVGSSTLGTRSDIGSAGSSSFHSQLFRKTNETNGGSGGGGVDELNSSLVVDFLNPKKQSTIEFVIKITIITVLVSLAIYATIDYHYASTSYLEQYGDDFIAWVEQNPATGLYTFVFVYFLTTVLFVPSVILMVGAGFAFVQIFGVATGIVIACCAVFLGETLAALASFLLARYLLRSYMTQIATQYVFFQALDRCFTDNGLPIMCLLRLSPATPFAVLNYLAGITGISSVNYFLSLFAVIPPTILFVLVGASASSLQEIQEKLRHNENDDNTTNTDATTTTAQQEHVLSMIAFLAGILCSVAAIFLTMYYTKKEIDRILIEMEGNTYIANIHKIDDNNNNNKKQQDQDEEAQQQQQNNSDAHTIESNNVEDIHDDDNEERVIGDKCNSNNNNNIKQITHTNIRMHHHRHHHAQQRQQKQQQLQKFTSLQRMHTLIANNDTIIRSQQPTPRSTQQLPATTTTTTTTGRKRTVLRIVHKNNSSSSNATTTSASSVCSINSETNTSSTLTNKNDDVFTNEMEDIDNDYISYYM